MTTIDAIRTDDRQPVGATTSHKPGGISAFLAILSSALWWLERQLEKRRSRRILLELTDDQLKDIGITRADAYGEAYRRFWD
jgi:uncharacterized protein YjiS (DUF1127 family)